MRVTMLQGHAPDVLRGLPAESVHCVITSPPYWLLRSYKSEPQLWANPDGTPLCIGDTHEWVGRQSKGATLRNGAGASTLNSPQAFPPEAVRSTVATCTRCGAWRGELGQEPTVELYVAHVVECFRAVRRVLRRDGTLWLNLAPSYFNDSGGQSRGTGNVSARNIAAQQQNGPTTKTKGRPAGYWLKPLDYVDVPGLAARALQQDGWLWRADIALVKRSPLPESVQGWRWERCRVKVAKNKHVDSQGRGGFQRMMENPEDNRGINPDWLAEWADCPGCARCAPNDGLLLRRGNGRPTRAWERLMVFCREPGAFWNSQAVREEAEYGYRSAFHSTKYTDNHALRQGNSAVPDVPSPSVTGSDPAAGRNLRDWQYWPTTGGVRGEEHYATYSTELVKLALKAGTADAVCSRCGAPWAIVITDRRYRSPLIPGQHPEVHEPDTWKGSKSRPRKRRDDGTFLPRGDDAKATLAPEYGVRGSVQRFGDGVDVVTLGSRPTCACHAEPAPAVVLDPFAGSGTTALAAQQMGRDAILIDVQPSYVAMQQRQLASTPVAMPLFPRTQIGHQEVSAR